MNKNTLAAALVTSLMLGFAACKSDEVTPIPPTPPVVTGSVVEVSGEIKTNTTWAATNKYLLKGYVYVRAGATLTIEAGTIIKGDKDSKGSLLIEPGAKLNAVGTVAKPIVFTSNQPKGSRNYGDWGGVIIAGNAPTNNIVNGTKPTVEGGPTTTYGGTDAADNSGTIQYVRIEFAGIAFSPNNEINGLTLCAVGSGTTLDHIQVSYSGDDSFEWFGGTVNGKYLIAHRGFDDDFDTDNGYSGKNQFLVSLRDPLAADQSGSKGFESDNDANGSLNLPQTSCVFSNVTMVGPLLNPTGTGAISPQYVSGVHIRRNSSLSMFNSVVMGWPAGILIDGQKSATNIANNTLVIKNSVVAGNPTGPNSGANTKNGQKDVIYYGGAGGGPGSLTPTNTTFADSSFFGSAVGPMTWFFNPANANKRYNTPDNLRLLNPFSLTAPNFTPTSTSPLVFGTTTMPTPAAVVPAYTDAKLNDPFFVKVGYIGAFAGTGTTADNWTSGWSNFDPQNTDY